MSGSSGITTGEILAAAFTPVVVVILLAGLIFLLLVICLVKMKRERLVHCDQIPTESYNITLSEH